MSDKLNVRSFFAKNNVTVMFVALCIGAFFASGFSLPSLFDELFVRIGRNTFMVLSLLVPVVAGLGLNFGIVIGAIAAQIAIFLVLLWGGTGLSGMALCFVIATPLAIFFGYLVGKLFNNMKGAEMIGGMVSGFFSDGLYQLLFLFILGGVITINNSTLMISTGVGVKNIMNLEGNLKQVIDDVPMISILDAVFWVALAVCGALLLFRLIKKRELGLPKLLKVFVPIAVLYAASYIPVVTRFLSTPRLNLLNAVEYGCLIVVLRQAYIIIRDKFVSKLPGIPKKPIIYIGIAGVVYLSTYIQVIFDSLRIVRLPVLTYCLIGGLYVAIPWFLNTKLGQDMRTVGHDRTVASSSGINVDRIRVIAMIISTVLASYGHLISLQNIGTVGTYGSHVSVGLYAIAALLVGGASVQQANAKQALLGVVLFHTLFILSPNAGRNLFGNAQVGEFFRLFVAYFVIALALAMHAWSNRRRALRSL